MFKASTPLLMKLKHLRSLEWDCLYCRAFPPRLVEEVIEQLPSLQSLSLRGLGNSDETKSSSIGQKILQLPMLTELRLRNSSLLDDSWCLNLSTPKLTSLEIVDCGCDSTTYQVITYRLIHLLASTLTRLKMDFCFSSAYDSNTESEPDQHYRLPFLKDLQLHTSPDRLKYFQSCRSIQKYTHVQRRPDAETWESVYRLLSEQYWPDCRSVSFLDAHYPEEYGGMFGPYSFPLARSLEEESFRKFCVDNGITFHR